MAKANNSNLISTGIFVGAFLLNLDVLLPTPAWFRWLAFVVSLVLIGIGLLVTLKAKSIF